MPGKHFVDAGDAAGGRPAAAVQVDGLDAARADDPPYAWCLLAGIADRMGANPLER